MDGYFFLTEQDPNYTIKGSRDPLGLQVIWQNAGRKIIPHLSTVSNNVMDFQILSLAYALKKKYNMTEPEFEDFFIPFEQLFAYTRHKLNSSPGFNGIRQVRKNVSSNSKKIDIGFTKQIMSNQKAYGIWGKYNRPYSDMGIVKDKLFDAVFNSKIEANPELLKISEKILNLGRDKVHRLDLDQLNELFPLLEKPEGVEKDLFEKYLLQDTTGKFELLQILKNSEVNMQSLRLYLQVNYLQKQSDNIGFKTNLEFIKNIEKTISPLNRIFKYILTKSYWKEKELSEDGFISNWTNRVDQTGFQEDLLKLSRLHQTSNLKRVEGLVDRNESVAAQRQSAPWLNYSKDHLEVNHHEGDFLDRSYSPEEDSDFNYFLDSYFSLYNQLN